MQKINKSTIFVVLIAIIIILVVVKIIQIKIRQEQQIAPESLDKIKTQDQFQIRQKPKLRYQFVGKIPNLTSTANIYQTDNEAIIDQQKISQIINYFKLPEGKTDKDAIGEYYEAKDEHQYLNIYPQIGQLSYETYDKANDNLPKKSQRYYQDVAKSVVSALVSSKIYDYQISEVEFLKIAGIERIIPTQISNADWIRIRINYKFNNYPIITSELNESAITFTLNPDGSIHKLKMQFLPENNLKSLGLTKLAKPKEAIQAINSGAGQINQFFDPKDPYQAVDTSTIYSAQFKKLEIIYILDESSRQIQPYYQFSGEAVNEKRQSVNIKAIISALPEQLFKTQKN